MGNSTLTLRPLSTGRWVIKCGFALSSSTQWDKKYSEFLYATKYDKESNF